MNKIIPAILVKTFERIEEKAEIISTFSQRAQIDICDGEYVGSKTWPFFEISRADFLQKSKGMDDLFLPFWEEVDFTADLMCSSPADLLKIVCMYGFDEVVLHFRSLQDEFQNKRDEFINFENYLENVFSTLEKFEVGIILAADSKTDIAEFLKVVSENSSRIKYLQIMGIEKIGYQGQTFSEKTVLMTREVKEFLDKENLNLEICIDGGMDMDTIAQCKAAGANIFVVGSALGLDTDEYRLNYKDFQKV